MNRSGIVIGGNHAGQFHSAGGEYLRLAIIGPVSPYPDPQLMEIGGLIEESSERYKFISMHWRNDDEGKEWKFGFWVPVDVRNPQPFILQELINGYVDTHS